MEDKRPGFLYLCAEIWALSALRVRGFVLVPSQGVLLRAGSGHILYTPPFK